MSTPVSSTADHLAGAQDAVAEERGRGGADAGLADEDRAVVGEGLRAFALEPEDRRQVGDRPPQGGDLGVGEQHADAREAWRGRPRLRPSCRSAARSWRPPAPGRRWGRGGSSPCAAGWRRRRRRRSRGRSWRRREGAGPGGAERGHLVGQAARRRLRAPGRCGRAGRCRPGRPCAASRSSWMALGGPGNFTRRTCGSGPPGSLAVVAGSIAPERRAMRPPGAARSGWAMAEKKGEQA